MAPPWPWSLDTPWGDPRRDASGTKTAGNARRNTGMQEYRDAGAQGRTAVKQHGNNRKQNKCYIMK